MDGNTIAALGALTVAVLGAVGTIYVTILKRKSEEKNEDRGYNREDRAIDKEADRIDREIVVKQWKEYASSLNKAHESSANAAEARHKADIEKLEAKNLEQDREIAALFEKERQCQIQFTSAQTKICYLEREIAELRKMIEASNSRKSNGEIKSP